MTIPNPVLLFVAVATLACGDTLCKADEYADLPVDLRVFIERAKLETNLAIYKLERSRVSATVRKKIEEAVARIEEEGQIAVPALTFPLTQGDIGRMPLDSAEVQQVIDDENMLIKVGGQTVWVSGVGTGNLTDDSNVKFTGQAFEVKKTRQYQTVIGGSRTVEHIELFDTDAIRKYFKQAPRPRGWKPTPSESRTWTILLPKGRMQGQLADYSNGVVTIKSPKKTHDFLLSQLSIPDRRYVADEYLRIREELVKAVSK